MYHAFNTKTNTAENRKALRPPSLSLFEISLYFLMFSCIKCSLCNLLYVGETSRCLGDRIHVNIFIIFFITISINKPASRKINLSDHSLSNIIVVGLSLISCNNDCRNTKEMWLIHLFGHS